MRHVPILAFIFLALSYVNETRASCTDRPSLNVHRTIERKLWYHDFKVIPGVLSPYQCADACLRDARCKSFNYKRKQNSDEKNVCEMNDVKWNDASPGEVTKTTGWDLYDVDFEGLQEILLNPEASCGYPEEVQLPGV